jgi:prepilin-type N-terminal cleavage/methylation domain-containing protein
MNTQSFSQKGMSLMEVLVAMSISLVVTASMIALMANSLGTTARIIKMTKLTDDMRITMQMMSRDVRRSSYNANSMFCYANDDCDGEVTAAGQITLANDITINNSNDCFTFLMDRDHDGDSTENSAGGFRRVISSGVGVIEMWNGDQAPDCAAAAGSSSWVQITNPDNMDIFAFSVDENLSSTVEIFNDGVDTLSQKIRKVRMNLRGRLVLDNSIRREIEDVISVRNDLLL